MSELGAAMVHVLPEGYVGLDGDDERVAGTSTAPGVRYSDHPGARTVFLRSGVTIPFLAAFNY